MLSHNIMNYKWEVKEEKTTPRYKITNKRRKANNSLHINICKTTPEQHESKYKTGVMEL